MCNALKTSIAPFLSVRGGTRAIEFYKNAFGAVESFHLEDGSGSVVARLSVGDAQFWLADESPANLNFSPESLGGGTVRMVLTVENPDATLQDAVSAGAKQVWPVIVDPFGHHWEIGRPLSVGV
jgi:Uncharacterized protein conserved in bacteria